jgi:hypothetical protein
MEKKLGLLDALLELREHFDDRIGFLPYIVEPSVTRLVGFIDGYWTARFHLGGQDELAKEFFLWLRDVKKEFPSEGWDQKFLRDCGGNEREAIRKFLNFAAEFSALRQ